MGFNITSLTFLKADRKNSATVISWMTSIVSPDYVWNLGDVLIWLVAYIWFHQYYATDRWQKVQA